MWEGKKRPGNLCIAHACSSNISCYALVHNFTVYDVCAQWEFTQWRHRVTLIIIMITKKILRISWTLILRMPWTALKSSSISGIPMTQNLHLLPRLLHWTFQLTIADLLSFFVKEVKGLDEEKRRNCKRHSNNPSVLLKKEKGSVLIPQKSFFCLMPLWADSQVKCQVTQPASWKIFTSR